jgi:hypothetical protein
VRDRVRRVLHDPVLMAPATSTCKKLKPDGGTVCPQLGNVAADNINARGAGFRDTISGTKGIGQRRFERGYRAPSVMIDLIDGKQLDPVIFTGLDECTADNVDSCNAQ